MKYSVLWFLVYLVLSSCSNNEKSVESTVNTSNSDINVTDVDTANNKKSEAGANPKSSKSSDSTTLNQLKKTKLSTKKESFYVWDPFLELAYTLLPWELPMSERSKGVKLKIDWVENVQGDFSFTTKLIGKESNSTYDYPTSMREKDSLLNSRLRSMRDSLGNSLPDSINLFHSIVDTSLHYTIISQSEDSACSGTRMMRITGMENGIRAFFYCDEGSLRTLHLEIIEDSLSAWIEWVMVDSQGQRTIIIKLKEGKMKIDRGLFNKGIFKAEFNLVFESYFGFMDDPNEPKNTWEGLIYGKIQ